MPPFIGTTKSGMALLNEALVIRPWINSTYNYLLKNIAHVLGDIKDKEAMIFYNHTDQTGIDITNHFTIHNLILLEFRGVKQLGLDVVQGQHRLHRRCE